jgi:hypothetical protein
LHANFCCIQDCNEPVGTTNFHDEPGFAYAVDPTGAPDPNNYHLSATSVCIDRANPDPAMGYASQVDYDNEQRQYGDAVDVGADEVYDCSDDYLSDADIHNACDFDADGIVNMNDFNLFSKAWRTYDPNCTHLPNPVAPSQLLNWNPVCDLDHDLAVDLTDLMLFFEDTPQNWLWIACWRADLLELQQQQTMQMMSGLVLPVVSMVASSQAEALTVECAVVIPAQAGIQSASEIVAIVDEKSIAEQIADLQDSIEFLEQIWNQEPDIQQEIYAEEWQDFINSVKSNLLELQTEIIQIE